jgi:hypothetical protein
MKVLEMWISDHKLVTLWVYALKEPHYHLIMEQYLILVGFLCFWYTFETSPQKNPLPLTKGLVAPTRAIL